MREEGREEGGECVWCERVSKRVSEGGREGRKERGRK